MKIDRMPDPIDALVITDTFPKKELDLILNEASNLIKNDDGSGVWLNDIYKDVDVSVINQAFREHLTNDYVADSLEQINSMYGLFHNVNQHSTRINYYGQSQSSPMRYDSAAFIIKTFLHTEPRNFSGGEATLQINGDIAYEKDVENNMTIIFPASYYHQVSEVALDDKEIDGSGLFVITTYLFIMP